MSADLLREAAALMRSRAKTATEGPWSLTFIPESAVPSQHAVDRHYVMGCFDGNARNPAGPAAMCEYEPDAEHIAGMHPAVALAVADWLDATAGELDQYGWDGLPSNATAVAVARAYLDGPH